ncbi:hypothetical protein RHMOL_Rhmol03G0106900 [Rhododendron molle]|uniref:Uncharacterized protein n=1 Tax=Rhododendron molle TaxID=49168 RepID=A0ACC0PEC8_RHOML|nr:hypothetical protein RHMOL_Rhmol03G0106900 [Rhododendron molle]
MSLREVATNPSQVSSSYEAAKGGFYSWSPCPLLHNSRKWNSHSMTPLIALALFNLSFSFSNGETALQSGYYMDPTAQLKPPEELARPHQSRPPTYVSVLIPQTLRSTTKLGHPLEALRQHQGV